TPARSANVCCDICRRCRASRSVSIPSSPSHVPSAESRCGGTGFDSADRILRSTHSYCKPLDHGMKRYTDGLFPGYRHIRIHDKMLSPRTFTAYVPCQAIALPVNQAHGLHWLLRSYATFARLTQW